VSNYHNLLDIGRAVVDAAVPRPLGQRLLRESLRAVVPNAGLFKALTQVGNSFRPLLPGSLKSKLPGNIRPAKARPTQQHARQVLILEGCVQPGLSPNTNAATARVLDACGISVKSIAQAGCCGAVDYHLDAQEQGLNAPVATSTPGGRASRAGAQAIVQTASGCGAFVKDYGHLLRDDPAYADKAARVSELTKDLVEVLRAEPLEKLGGCTSQTGVSLPLHPAARAETRWRSGSGADPAGLQSDRCARTVTYAVARPALIRSPSRSCRQLRDNKMNALESGRPEVIATANIGCQTHLASAGRTPVKHWIELIEDALHPS
jgi:glycolate oxidase iron-sulfur subunit